MNQQFFKQSLLATGLALAGSAGYAAEITFNGFASFVGGKTLNEETLLDGTKSTYLADPVHAHVDGLPNDDARYDDEFSYRPDSNYGLQVSADLGRGLKATAQITGKGSNDFEAEIEWIYLSYAVNENLTVQAGRQRIPLYFYSDFLDIGYAYHWIRPPVELYGSTLSTYEGVSATYKAYLGDWDASVRAYTGATISDDSRFGAFGSDNMSGLVLTANNEWVRLRASFLNGDFFTKNTTTDEDNGSDSTFGSLAAYFTLGNGFLAGEATRSQVNDGDYLDTVLPSVQVDHLESFMVTAGYQIGNFTPHVSYAEFILNLSGGVTPELEGLESITETTTVGLRWDFHPSAAFKVEYSTSTDASDEEIIASQGKANEVDLVSFGFDVIF